MSQCDIGLIGLAVMGENLVLNMESKGFSVAVYNRTTAVTDAFGEPFNYNKRDPRAFGVLVSAPGIHSAAVERLADRARALAG